MLLSENLVDETQVFVMLIILTDGINVFALFPKETKLKRTDFFLFIRTVKLKYNLG